MLHFTNFSAQNQEAVLYLQQEASKTIAYWFREEYFLRTGEPDCDNIRVFASYLSYNVLKNLNNDFDIMCDEVVLVKEIANRLCQMVDKAEDRNTEYTFDQIEKYLLYTATIQFRDDLATVPVIAQMYQINCKQRERQIANILQKKFKYTYHDAVSAAKTVCRYDQMASRVNTNFT